MNKLKKFFPLALAFGDGKVAKFVIGIVVCFAIVVVLEITCLIVSMIPVIGWILKIPVNLIATLIGFYLITNLIVLIVAFVFETTGVVTAETAKSESAQIEAPVEEKTEDEEDEEYEEYEEYDEEDGFGAIYEEVSAEELVDDLEETVEQ